MIKINKIYNENCLNTMSRMPDNFINLTITSPPYDNLRDYKGYDFDFQNIVKDLFRITKKGGVVVWVVGDSVVKGSESGTSFKQALYFKEIGFNLCDTMIYQKNGMTSNPEKKRYYQSFEFMFIFTKNKLKIFNPIEDRKNKWTGSWGQLHYRNKKGELINKGKVKCKEYGRRFNVWKYNTGSGFSTKDEIAYKHPAIFPERLAYDHIISWSNKGDLIYDPMAGSGTVLKMAVESGRNYIGSEISKEYCKIIQERIRTAQKPLIVI